MSHPDFENIGNIEDIVIDECSELIKELCKVKRFGWLDFNPFDPEKKLNYVRVKDEIQDVKKAIEKLEMHMYTLITI